MSINNGYTMAIQANMEVNWVLTKSMIGESLLAGKGGSNVLDAM